LGSNQNVGSNAPSSSTDDDSSSTNSYQPVSESSSSSSTNTDNNPKKRSLGNSEPDMPFNPFEDDSDYSNDLPLYSLTLILFNIGINAFFHLQ
jgi:hypothetical protein